MSQGHQGREKADGGAAVGCIEIGLCDGQPAGTAFNRDCRLGRVMFHTKPQTPERIDHHARIFALQRAGQQGTSCGQCRADQRAVGDALRSRRTHRAADRAAGLDFDGIETHRKLVSTCSVPGCSLLYHRALFCYVSVRDSATSPNVPMLLLLLGSQHQSSPMAHGKVRIARWICLAFPSHGICACVALWRPIAGPVTASLGHSRGSRRVYSVSAGSAGSDSAVEAPCAIFHRWASLRK